MNNLNTVFKQERVSLLDNKFLNWDSNKAGIGLELIGVKDGKLVLVGQYNWQVYEIDFNSIEHKGKLLGAYLADVREHPEILLEDAKVMSVKDIEKALGHKVIVSDY